MFTTIMVSFRATDMADKILHILQGCRQQKVSPIFLQKMVPCIVWICILSVVVRDFDLLRNHKTIFFCIRQRIDLAYLQTKVRPKSAQLASRQLTWQIKFGIFQFERGMDNRKFKSPMFGRKWYHLLVWVSVPLVSTIDVVTFHCLAYLLGRS